MKKITKISSGLAGLDEVLRGGLVSQKSYLVQGGPGSGKSTLGLHFLVQGVQENKNALYITLGESKESIIQNASAFGFDVSGVDFLDLSPGDHFSEDSGSYTVFSPAEVEQQPLMEAIKTKVEELKPSRVFLDSITMLRMLNNDAYQMRKLALSFINYLTAKGATLLMTSEHLDNSTEQDATFWVDGIIELENSAEWRKIRVSKLRGSSFLKGNHAFKITGEGIEIYPRLRPNEYNLNFKQDQLSSGITEIDQLLHGGIEKGTTSLIVGPTGAGKTNLGLQFLKEAAIRNNRSVIYTFEESKELILQRSKMVNLPIEEMIEEGNLRIVPVEPLSYSPDEFSKMVRTDVEDNNTQMVMIDSIGGYELAIREENILERLHSLTVYLQNMGVTTLLINESQNITGNFTATNMNASYLADNIVFLRYLEVNGELQKAIGVLKKRLSDFEKSIRSYKITGEGIEVGKPLSNMRGILTGLPEVAG